MAVIFEYDHHIPCTYLDNIAVFLHSIKKEEEEIYKL